MRLLLALLVLLLASCVSESHNVRLPVTKIVGTYYFGDGIGPGEELVLHSNGTFTSTIGGDLLPDTAFHGTWSVDGDKIIFHDAGMVPGRKPIHTYAITQLYKGQVVLLPGDRANDPSVSYSFLYRKQPE